MNQQLQTIADCLIDVERLKLEIYEWMSARIEQCVADGWLRDG